MFGGKVCSTCDLKGPGGFYLQKFTHRTSEEKVAIRWTKHIERVRVKKRKKAQNDISMRR